MFHPIPKPFKGNYPFAVLHAYRADGIPEAIAMAKKLSKDALSNEEALLYVKAVVETKGHPQILDLIEEEREAKIEQRRHGVDAELAEV
jgi:hypothetical protein